MVKLNILRPVGRCLYLIKAAEEVMIYRPAVFTLHYKEITQLELDQPRQHSKEISPFNDNEKTANPSQGRRDGRIQAQSLYARGELSTVMRGDVMPVKYRLDASTATAYALSNLSSSTYDVILTQ